MAKTTKKNKLVIEWPTTPFSIQDVQEKYSDAKNITLRFRINNAVRDGIITYIGKTPKAVGRPTIMFAPTPISKENLKLAAERGVILDEQFEKQPIDVVKVDGSTETVKTKKTTKLAVEQTA